MHRTTIAKYTTFSADELQKSLSDPLSCVAAVQLNEILSLRPRDCEHIVKGVRRCVTDKIGRYHPKVNGIVLGYAKIRIDNALSALRLDSPFLHVRSTIDYYVFQPRIGSTLRGTVNYVSKQFVSAVIYRVFNVTVKLGKFNNQQHTVKKGSDIAFIVKSCDMKSELPVIEGELVVNGVIPVRIKQEPDADSNKSLDSSDNDQEEENGTVEPEIPASTLPAIKQEASKTKKTKKQKEPEKTTIVSNGTGSVQLDSSDSSDDSDDEKNLLIKSLMSEVFGDEFTKAESSKKHKKKKGKSSKKKSMDEPVRIKQEQISTDEEVASESGQNTSTSNAGSGLSNGKNGLTNGSSTISLKKNQPEVAEKRRKSQFDLNATITHIKTEPTESKKNKKKNPNK
ncbi:probable DNA-directed RNA polymerase I subunit RPA43 [Anopheles marshallii]|uniref:probable DNA-directed RNA polymerase I subunit RPA43 n=1 Tax=Anopheles marshallii TaxID=1521116 RepID=UPI00237A3502|nr:probable DNA-directed RNA polymerase I subunit RPA43 [Anopheles marshallii]